MMSGSNEGVLGVHNGIMCTIDVYTVSVWKKLDH